MPRTSGPCHLQQTRNTRPLNLEIGTTDPLPEPLSVSLHRGSQPALLPKPCWLSQNLLQEESLRVEKSRSYYNWQMKGSTHAYIPVYLEKLSPEPAPWHTLVFWGALQPGFVSLREQKQACGLIFL